MEPAPVSTGAYLVLSVILFTMGALGVLIRRNAILVFMSVELMLNAANLALIAFARHYNQLDGQIIVFFIMTIAAAEVAVGLALIVVLFRTRHSIVIDEMSMLKE